MVWDQEFLLPSHEHGTSIDIPTFHVFGSNDPLVYSSVALYNACNQDMAQLYDHGLGHLVPRDADNVEQLGDTLGRRGHEGDRVEAGQAGRGVNEFRDAREGSPGLAAVGTGVHEDLLEELDR